MGRKSRYPDFSMFRVNESRTFTKAEYPIAQYLAGAVYRQAKELGPEWKFVVAQNKDGSITVQRIPIKVVWNGNK